VVNSCDIKPSRPYRAVTVSDDLRFTSPSFYLLLLLLLLLLLAFLLFPPF